MTAELADIVQDRRQRGELPTEIAADHLARVIAGSVPGYILRLATLGAAGVAGLPDAVRALRPN
jgi:hypothetical protein